MRGILKNGVWVFIGALLVFNFFVWQRDSYSEMEGLLRVAFLDIGQGDSIYIEGPNGVQVLIDGGGDARVLSELGKLMSFGDRTIDVLVITNPDQDHYGGFLDVLKTYDISYVLEPGTRTPNQTYKELRGMIQEEGAERILARRGMNIDLGDGAHLNILLPDRDVSNMSRNDGSIIARLEYGSTSVMFTGDTTKIIEEYMVNHYRNDLPSSVLKIAHHGSRTSTGKKFVEAVSPEYAVISSGKENSYGHPHRETLDTLKQFGIKVFRTDTDGTIQIFSNGEVLIFR